MSNMDFLDLIYKEAFSEAMKAPKNVKYFHGAILLSKNGKIISRGYNRYSLNSDLKNLEQSLRTKLSFDGKCSVHAEVDCLQKLNFSQKAIKGSTIVVYGQSKAGNVVKSRPCQDCMKLLRAMRVKRAVYSNTQNTRIIEEIQL